jgi:histidinol phosphatase-like enzyme (inositol monophosphatase family)
VHPPPADQRLLDDAVAIARAAGDTTLAWFRSPDLVVDRKGDGTPVTEADRGAEAHARAVLAEAYPDDAILGEEEGESAGSSGRRWLLDPIDGTKAFTRGVPLYTTLVAVEDEHGIAVGVIHMPALRETVWAGRGRGCWCDGTPARVSTRTSLRGAVLTTSGFDYWPEASLVGVRRSELLMRTWGDGYGYALVATGRAEAMVDPVVAPYDVAPMPVILAEAGGRFSDWSGADRIDGGTGLATNGPLHEEIRRLLTEG